ncbi:uncharacterized protein LOC129980647 [Argiope bruennichi]|uniref:uncharacterized protein LOC129980647 n=1 Tax=Argiope bruennichi TaxID=94029 RepID=UPI002493E2C7|nr:uncharacterized protein LOC129980647 [Argiope bruennichi]
MMFCLILLSSFIAVKGTENSFYPFIIPISTGRGHSQHTTHVFTHPVIRTQVLVLGAGDHQPQSSDEQYRDGYHYDQKFQQTYKYRPNDYRDESSIHQPRAHGLSPSAKYSIPVEQSSWKPIRSIPLDYLPLKYLGEDGPAVAKVVYESMSASKHSSDDDDEGPLILPVGIKKLHNPQLRRPPRRKPEYFYGNSLTEGRHTKEPQIFKVQIGQKGTFVRSEQRAPNSVHCQCRVPKD